LLPYHGRLEDLRRRCGAPRAGVGELGGGDLVDHVQAFDHLAERGVRAIEVDALFTAEADEELRAGRVGVAAAGHGEDTLDVLAVVELRLDAPAGAARAVTLGAAALDDELGKDA